MLYDDIGDKGEAHGSEEERHSVVDEPRQSKEWILYSEIFARVKNNGMNQIHAVSELADGGPHLPFHGP